MSATATAALAAPQAPENTERAPQAALCALGTKNFSQTVSHFLVAARMDFSIKWNGNCTATVVAKSCYLTSVWWPYSASINACYPSVGTKGSTLYVGFRVWSCAPGRCAMIYSEQTVYGAGGVSPVRQRAD